MQQLLSAVSYCHRKNIMHKDLKPENILLQHESLDNMNIKIIDFGLSVQYDPSERQHSAQGTPFYIAPEILRQDFNEKVDIWSCGVILYLLLSGRPPFVAPTTVKIFQKILKGTFSFKQDPWPEIS